jgi:serine/threonine-protein kinase SRPK3
MFVRKFARIPVARHLPRSSLLLCSKTSTFRRVHTITKQSSCESDIQPLASDGALTINDPFEEEPLNLGAHTGFGFARIVLGEKVGSEGQFEVIRKLCWGLCGSVWMVKDLKYVLADIYALQWNLMHLHRQNLYLAMKVLTSHGTQIVRGEVKNRYHHHLDEANILRRISRKTCSPGAKHCLQFVDDFYINRETGRHLCILTEITGLSMDSLQGLITSGDGLPSGFAKLFVKHLCLALDYLHSECRIVDASWSSE